MSTSDHARLHDLVKAVRRQRSIASLLPTRTTTLDHLTAVSEASRQFWLAHAALTPAELSSFKTMLSALDGDGCAEDQPLSPCARVIDLDGAVVWLSVSEYDKQFCDTAYHSSDAKSFKLRDLALNLKSNPENSAKAFVQVANQPNSSIADAFRSLDDVAFVLRESSQISTNWKDSCVLNNRMAAVKFNEQSKRVMHAWNDVTASISNTSSTDGSMSISNAAAKTFGEVLGHLAMMCHKPHEV